MKSLVIAALGLGFIATSCSSVYRSEQTPDDVYFSPARTEQKAILQSRDDRQDDDYVAADNGRRDGRRYQEEDSYSGYDDYASPNDRWLMMRVRNPSRWSAFDNYGYGSPYNSFGYNGFGGGPYGNMGYGGMGSGFGVGYGSGFGIGYGSGFYDPYMYGSYGFNNYYNWNSFYNPYYQNIIVVNPKTNPAGYTRVRSFNVNRYSNSAVGSRRAAVRPNYNGYVNPNSRMSNNSNRNGGTYRRVVSPNNSRVNNSSQDRPVRTYDPTPNNTYSPRSSGSSNSGAGGSTGGGSNSGGRPRR